MPTPPSEPHGRPTDPEQPRSSQPIGPDGSARQISKQSTNSHHPVPESLSDVLRRPESSRRSSAGSDLFNRLAGSPVVGQPAATSPDDEPTVITSLHPRASSSQPLVSQATGDLPSIAGRRLGHYELIESIGAGGMAAVLKARDLELGRVVALKILPPESARDPESITRFRQEARAAALLDHENVARVYSCGEDQGLHFIAFEFVEGVNLRVLIDNQGVISARDCVRYMIQVAAGLAHAAQRGVVHRDIKPSNIIITPDGRAKIVDMGLARQLDAIHANGGVTQSGVTLGTFDYISPEQALDPRRADARSDIYSLGCAFYHALTGRPPVPEGTAAKKLHAHQHTDPLDPRQLNPLIPDELVLILARMMAKDPARRYQTPAELISHLKGLAETLRLSTDLVDHDSIVRAVPAERSVLPPPPGLRLGWVIGVAAAAIAVAVFAFSGGNLTTPSGPPPWATGATATRDTKADSVIIPPDGQSPPVRVVADGDVRTAAELAARLANPQTTRIVLAPRAEIDLTTLAEPLVFEGKELALVGSTTAPAVMRVNATPCEASATTPRAGTLLLPAVTTLSVSGIRFEVANTTVTTDAAKELAEAVLAVPEASEVLLNDCVFAVPQTAGSVSVGGVRIARTKARVRVDRCVFACADFGIWLPDGCDATISDSGFGPHEAAVLVGEYSPATVNTSGPNAIVRLIQSSFLLMPETAAVRNISPARGGGDGPAVQVTAGYCVFSRLGSAMSFPNGGRPVVVRSAGEGRDVGFTGEPGRKNAYYGIFALLADGDGEARYLTFEECATERLPVEDAGATLLTQRPWAESDPLRTLASLEPWRAFALTFADAYLAVPDRNNTALIGCQFLIPGTGFRKVYPNVVWPPELPRVSSLSESRQLVWYPAAMANEPLPRDTYTDLAFLLTNARPGDTVLIRHNGLLPIGQKTVELEKARNGASSEFRLKFQAAPGYSPILTAPGGDRIDQTLFRLMNGEVTFQGLQFLLKPNRPRDGQTVAAVQLVGGKACSFQECVFTLAEESDSKAAVVEVADPKPVMAMVGVERTRPDITFKQCVIRGKGRAVWVRVSRAVKTDFEQTLTAIDGPLYHAQPGGTPTLGDESNLRLHRVTAFAGGPIVEMRGGKVGEMRASGLTKLNVSVDATLFAALPNAGRSLVELDGIDPTEVDSILRWQAKTANRYADFDSSAIFMIVRPDSDGTTPKEWNWDQWLTFAREPAGADKMVGMITFAKRPNTLSELANVRPANAVVTGVDFPEVPEAKPADAGVAELLPVPANPEP